MGHVVNPVGYRLGSTFSSSHVWHVRNSYNYAFIFNKSQAAAIYLRKLFSQRVFRELILLSDIRIVYVRGFFEVHVFFFSTGLYKFLHTYIREKDWNARIFKTTYFVLKYVCRILVNEYFMNNYFKGLSSLIVKDLNFILNWKVMLNFFVIPQEALTASAWSDFICHKLKKKNTFSHTMTQVLPILKQMLYKELITGFKIACHGRMSRRGRASSYIRGKGATPFSSMTALATYSCRDVVLKNSLCGIKVWIFFVEVPLLLSYNADRVLSYRYCYK